MGPSEIGFAAAVLGGLISFLSPCVLPLVPAYLCYIAGTSLDRLTEAIEAQSDGTATLSDSGLTRRVTLGAVGFVLGFTTVFVMLGATASAINPLLLQYKGLLGQIAGAVIIILGLHFVGLLKIALFNREARFFPEFDMESAPPWVRIAGPYVVGLAFAFGWTPCIGPILGAILTIAASQDSLSYGVSLLTAYSLGLGIPFIAAAFAVRGFLGFSQRFRRHLHRVEQVAGVFLIITGLLIMTGSFELLALGLLDIFPWLGELG